MSELSVKFDCFSTLLAFYPFSLLLQKGHGGRLVFYGWSTLPTTIVSLTKANLSLPLLNSERGLLCLPAFARSLKTLNGTMWDAKTRLLTPYARSRAAIATTRQPTIQAAPAPRRASPTSRTAKKAPAGATFRREKE